MKQDVTFIVERLPDHEARCGIRFEGLHAELEQFEDELPAVTLRAEAQALSGSGFPSDLEIRANAYDQNGRVIGSGMFFIDAAAFFDFETLEIYLLDLESRPSKIRLFPKLN